MDSNEQPAPDTNPTGDAAPTPAPTPAPAPVAAPAVAVAAQPAVATDPGKTLGIVGFVMSILGFGVVSLVMSIIAKSQSKKAGYPNGLALAGIIISAVSMVIGAILFIFIIIAGTQAVKYCQENPTASECSSSSSDSSYYSR